MSHKNLTLAYQAMAADEAREYDAIAWSEGVIEDFNAATPSNHHTHQSQQNTHHSDNGG